MGVRLERASPQFDEKAIFELDNLVLLGKMLISLS
jgi:hypothetical protein